MGLHPTAIVSNGARLGQAVTVGPYAIIEEDTLIGDGCEIRAHAVVKRHAELGPENVVHEGAVIGGEPQDFSFAGGPTRLVIGARNRIREGVTIHRSASPDGLTAVGSECFLMAYVHIAHDCRIGDGVVMANNAALAGHVTIEDGAFLSAGVGVHQFSRIGRLAMIAGHTKLVQDALPFVTTDGHPGRAVGLNLVGLRRAGISSPQLRALKEAHRLLLRAALPLEDALQAMSSIGDPLVEELIAFVRGSKRGFAHAAPDHGAHL